MKSNDTRLRIALAVAALLSLPFASAQTFATEQQQPPVTQQPRPAPQPSTVVPQPQPTVQPPAPVPPPTPAPAPPAPPPTQPPATEGQAAQPPAPNHATPSGGSVVLLDRISDLVDQALGEKPAEKPSGKGTPGAKGTSGTLKVGKSSAGTVVIDRAALDEIRAEVEQLKIMLKDKEP